MIVRPLDQLSDFDSRKLWHKVSAALSKGNIDEATDEKLAIDTMMKAAAKEREERGIEYSPKLFEKDDAGRWVYKYTDLTKWTEKQKEELEEIEEDGIISSRPRQQQEAGEGKTPDKSPSNKKKKKNKNKNKDTGEGLA